VRARIGICVGAVAIVAALPALAGGTTTSYRGSFDPSGRLSFRSGNHHHMHVVIGFKFTKFPLHCEHGPNTESTGLDPNYYPRIKHRTFHAYGLIGDRAHPRSELLLTGTFSRDRSRAHGTMHVFGSHVPVDDQTNGKTDHCNSGKLAWTAHRL
jgi:hypothetical protein